MGVVPFSLLSCVEASSQPFVELKLHATNALNLSPGSQELPEYAQISYMHLILLTLQELYGRCPRWLLSVTSTGDCGMHIRPPPPRGQTRQALERNGEAVYMTSFTWIPQKSWHLIFFESEFCWSISLAVGEELRWAALAEPLMFPRGVWSTQADHSSYSYEYICCVYMCVGGVQAESSSYAKSGSQIAHIINLNRKYAKRRG